MISAQKTLQDMGIKKKHIIIRTMQIVYALDADTVKKTKISEKIQQALQKKTIDSKQICHMTCRFLVRKYVHRFWRQ